MVAGEDKDIFGRIAVDKRYVLIYGVGGVLVPLGALYLLVGREDMHAAVLPVKIPRLAVADIIVELERLILREHADCVDAGVYAVRQRKIDYPVLAAVGDGRLCHIFGQNTEPAALTAGEQHSDTFCFSGHIYSSLLSVFLPCFFR